MVSVCVTCGAEMQATFNFCGKCGTKTNRSSTNNSISTGASPQKELCPWKYSEAVNKNNDKVFSRVSKTNHINNEHFLRPVRTTK